MIVVGGEFCAALVSTVKQKAGEPLMCVRHNGEGWGEEASHPLPGSCDQTQLIPSGAGSAFTVWVVYLQSQGAERTNGVNGKNGSES